MSNYIINRLFDLNKEENNFSIIVNDKLYYINKTIFKALSDYFCNILHFTKKSENQIKVNFGITLPDDFDFNIIVNFAFGKLSFNEIKNNHILYLKLFDYLCMKDIYNIFLKKIDKMPYLFSEDDIIYLLNIYDHYKNSWKSIEAIINYYVIANIYTIYDNLDIFYVKKIHQLLSRTEFGIFILGYIVKFNDKYKLQISTNNYKFSEKIYNKYFLNKYTYNINNISYETLLNDINISNNGNTISFVWVLDQALSLSNEYIKSPPIFNNNFEFYVIIKNVNDSERNFFLNICNKFINIPKDIKFGWKLINNDKRLDIEFDNCSLFEFDGQNIYCDSFCDDGALSVVDIFSMLKDNKLFIQCKIESV